MNNRTEGITTFLIPDDKRKEYFKYVEMFRSKVKNINDENWNTYNDPMVTINMSEFTFYQCVSIKSFMNRIGAKNVTESLLQD